VSLLNRATEDVVVYLEETTVDSDGNIMTRPSAVGIPARATIQVLAQSGTSSRRSEQDNEGFESEEVYRLRFTRSFTHVVGAQSRIEWLGVSWSIVGEPRRYNGSSRTRHLDYIIRRT
jgi:hypothetical protein